MLQEQAGLIFLKNDPLELERTVNFILYGPDGMLRSTFVDNSAVPPVSDESGGSGLEGAMPEKYLPQEPFSDKPEGTIDRQNDVLKGFVPGTGVSSSEDSSDFKQRSFSTGTWTGSRVQRLHALSTKQSEEAYSTDDLNQNLGLNSAQQEKTSAWDAVKPVEPNYEGLQSGKDGAFHHYSPMDFFADPEPEDSSNYAQDETIDGVPHDFAQALLAHERAEEAFDSGVYHPGESHGTPDQAAYDQAAPGDHQRVYDQGAYAEGSFEHGSLAQGSLDQGTPSPGSLGHVAYGQGSYDQEAYDPGEFDQAAAVNENRFDPGSAGVPPAFESDFRYGESYSTHRVQAGDNDIDDSEEHSNPGPASYAHDEENELAPLPQKMILSSSSRPIKHSADGDLVFEPLPAELANLFDQPTDINEGLPSEVDPRILAEMERERMSLRRVQNPNPSGGDREETAGSSGSSDSDEASSNSPKNVGSTASTPDGQGLASAVESQLPAEQPPKKSILEKLFGWLPFFKKDRNQKTMDASDVRALTRRKPRETKDHAAPVLEKAASDDTQSVIEPKSAKKEFESFPAAPLLAEPDVSSSQFEYGGRSSSLDSASQKVDTTDGFLPGVPQARVVDEPVSSMPSSESYSQNQATNASTQFETGTSSSPFEAGSLGGQSENIDSQQVEGGVKTDVQDPSSTSSEFDVAGGAAAAANSVAAFDDNSPAEQNADAVAVEEPPMQPPPEMTRLLDGPPIPSAKKDFIEEDSDDDSSTKPVRDRKTSRLRSMAADDESAVDEDKTAEEKRQKEKSKKVQRRRTAEIPAAKTGKKPTVERKKNLHHRNTEDKTIHIGPVPISSNFLIMCTVACVFVGFPAFVLLGLVKNIISENANSPMLPSILKSVVKEAAPEIPTANIPDNIPGMPGLQNAPGVVPQGAPGLTRMANLPGNLPGFPGAPQGGQLPGPAAINNKDLPEPMPQLPPTAASGSDAKNAIPSGQTKVASAGPATPPRKPDLKHLSGVWALDFKNQAGQIGRGQMVLEQRGNQIRGNGDDGYGSYQIGGTINKQRVSFRKAYIQNGRIVGNPIPYEGKLSMDKKRGVPRIDGVWKLSRREGYNTLSHVATHSYAFRAMMLEMAPDPKEQKAKAMQQQQQQVQNGPSLQGMLDTVPINDSSVPVQQAGPQ